MMILEWFNASEAARIGAALADQFAPRQDLKAAAPSASSATADPITEVLRQADREVRDLRLNFYKKAKFANSFKWRLLENGVEQALADEVTQRLVLHLSRNHANAAEDQEPAAAARPPSSRDAKYLLAQGNKSMEQGDYAEAAVFFEDLLKLKPRHAIAHNNLGSAYYKLGRYKEAEQKFYHAVRIKPDFPDAYSNIGSMLLLKGQYYEAESFLRRAIKLNPRFVDAKINLGLALTFLSRLREAKTHLDKALKYEPRNAEAIFGTAFIAKAEGNFDQASAMLSRALEASPGMPKALASQSGMRKMTSADHDWLKSAEAVAASGITPLDESELRFAIGKYHDDNENFKLAFQNYKLANEIMKPIAEPFDREAYRRFVDIMIQVHKPGTVTALGGGASASVKPVLLVGMPRSGTSLTEQIISSHPSAKGAGELAFWSQAVQEHGAAIRQGSFGESTRHKLAEAYLRTLETKSGDALRIVDKAPVNSDFLGVIHSVFPNARIIYMRRDPIDTCLSCYFQKFVLSLNYTMDLSDLAGYYREHHRLMAHWRAVLPKGTILDVPYEELVADQEGWTRRILDFVGLDWDERVMDFHKTNRAVVTASFWQVRQRIYQDSVRRWRHYETNIGPLLALKDLG